jgi:hypothetical protein
MSHECPECGCTCHCGGDIDDCCFNFEHYQNACTHCPADDDDEDIQDPLEACNDTKCQFFSEGQNCMNPGRCINEPEIEQ